MTLCQIQNECAYTHTHKNKEKQNKTVRGTGEVINLISHSMIALH